MTFYPDLGTKTQVAAGDRIRAIGWLSDTHPYAQGDVPATFITRLNEFVRLAAQSKEALNWSSFFGSHICELCPRKYGREVNRGGNDERPEGFHNFGVPAGDILFVAPEMIAHYVTTHHYAPPPEFIAAVLAAPLPDTQDYQSLVEPFRRPQFY